jgi:phosphatidylserine/phosphatidylglycerophosphate/cardiolipin synthase-like enzyme
MVQSVTDPSAILALTSSVSRSRIVHLPGLHAKTYIADDCAIITSGNLTAGGLFNNVECGVLLTEQSVVKLLHSQLLEIASLGAEIPLSCLTAYSDTFAKVSKAIQSHRRRTEDEFVREFKAALSPIDDELIRLRLSQGPIHSVFARTIEYLLREQDGMTTTEIHPAISALHPDLCDDSIDRVIDGKRFGKKWKHAVRTAQQQLKKKGTVTYVDGVWRLTKNYVK